MVIVRLRGTCFWTREVLSWRLVCDIDNDEFTTILSDDDDDDDGIKRNGSLKRKGGKGKVTQIKKEVQSKKK